MKPQSSRVLVGIIAPLLLAGAAAGSAAAADFKSVEPAAILYDAPSVKGKRLFVLRRFTPVEVLVSLSGFVKVREPEGAIGWVEKATLGNRRTLLANADKTAVRKVGRVDAALVFEAEKGVALELLEPPREGWAKVRHLDGQAGYVRVTQVWGL